MSSAGAENDRGQRERKQKRRGTIRSMATLPARSPHTMHSLVLTSVPSVCRSRSLLLVAHRLPHCFVLFIYFLDERHARENSVTPHSNVLHELLLRFEEPKLCFLLSSNSSREQQVKCLASLINTLVTNNFNLFIFLAITSKINTILFII